MTFVTLEVAQAKLPDLIRKQVPGEELGITIEGRTVAKLITLPPPNEAKPRRVLGAQRGSVLSMEHFDDPLEGLEEYQ